MISSIVADVLSFFPNSSQFVVDRFAQPYLAKPALCFSLPTEAVLEPNIIYPASADYFALSLVASLKTSPRTEKVQRFLLARNSLLYKSLLCYKCFHLPLTTFLKPHIICYLSNSHSQSHTFNSSFKNAIRVKKLKLPLQQSAISQPVEIRQIT